MTQTSNSSKAESNSPVRREKTEVTVNNETTLDAFMQIASRNPRFKMRGSETAREKFTKLASTDPRFVMRKPSGNAYVIGGAKPSGSTTK
jgi:hypothetical protein